VPYHQSDVRFIDTDGAAYGVKHVDNKPRVSAMPYLYDIAEGNVADHEAVRRFGYNNAVGTTWETVSAVSGLAPYLTSAERLNIASDDAADDGAPAGTGARTVRIVGLDGNYAEISETVTLNGETNVLTTAYFLRVFDMVVLTAGSTGANEGLITASNTADDAVLREIEIGENNSLNACYTVPAGHVFYITQVMASEGSTKGSTLAFWRRPFGGLWTKIRSVVLLDSSIVLPVAVPMQVPAKTDIEIRAKSALGAAKVSAGFEGWIETA